MFTNVILYAIDGYNCIQQGGFCQEKETEKVAGHFLDVTKDFILTKPSYEGRAMSVDDLEGYVQSAAGKKGIEVNVIDRIENASDSVKRASEIWNDYDVVLFTGSLYLIGEVRSIIQNNNYDPDRTLKYG